MDNYILGQGLLVISILISLLAQFFVTNSYSKYKKIKNKSGLTGFDVARKILDGNGLKDVYITEVGGNLSDHYDPNRKVVRLSSDVFHNDSIASVSIAAHEVGHALQDKSNYSFMKFRSTIFPLVRISSYGGYFAILIGILFGITDFIWLGVGFEIVILLFQLITLPVEFDASKRAKEELIKNNMVDKNELEGSMMVLKAAAFTYVASVITTLLQILRLVLIFGGRRDD